MDRQGFRKTLSEYSIWGFAFGYFACYIPYSLMTKIMSKGLLPALHGRSLDGFVILPVVAVATLLTMILVISLLGWWKYATHSKIFGLSLPRPTKWTFLSGLFTSLIIGTTTLAYTFESVSIVLAMLLMRGGVLITGPIVDATRSGRSAGSPGPVSAGRAWPCCSTPATPRDSASPWPWAWSSWSTSSAISCVSSS